MRNALFTFLIALWGCAAPATELWPPAENAHAHTVVVSLDTWHAMIAFALEGPRRDSKASAGAGAPLLERATAYEEWGYAERAWYLEGRQGFTGAVRALFWPSPGVVEVGLHRRIW